MEDFYFPDWSKIKTETELIDTLYPIIRSMGFSAGVFSYTPVGWLPSNDPGVIKAAISIKLKPEIFDSWLQHHNLKSTGSSEVMGHYYDVFRREMVNRITPKLFSVPKMLTEGYAHKSPAGDRWLRKQHALGLRQLLSVPYFSVRSEYWSLGLFRLDEESDDIEPTAQQIAILQHLVSNLAQFACDHLNWRKPGHEHVKRPLTKRELDCLHWAAKGLTAEQTAETLGLQVETVRKYLKSSIYKLGAPNKVAAVSIAHQIGLLGYNLDSTKPTGG